MRGNGGLAVETKLHYTVSNSGFYTSVLKGAENCGKTILTLLSIDLECIRKVLNKILSTFGRKLPSQAKVVSSRKGDSVSEFREMFIH